MSALDPSSPMPLWAQLAERLRQRIAAGEFSDRLPPEHELVQEYGVSRHTVREALRRLGGGVSLQRRRGLGTFLAPAAGLEQGLAGPYSLARTITEHGLEERSEVLACLRLQDAEGGTRLGLPAGEECVYVERLRFAGPDPLALDRSWIPASVGDFLLDEDLSRGSLLELLERHAGLRVTGGSTRITAAVPSPSERELLRVPRGEAILRVARLARAATTPVEWRVSFVRGDRYALVADWPPRPV